MFRPIALVRAAAVIGALLPLAAAAAPASDIITRAPMLSADVSPTDGSIAMDAAGHLWTLPASGGQATRLSIGGELSLSRPRWSPDGQRLLFHATGRGGTEIRITDRSGASTLRVSVEGVHSQDGAWHPDGSRIVYSADRRDSGMDLWETDVATGLAWRLTGAEGDETEPAWSADGRDLAWISRHEGVYRIIVRRRGEPEEVIVESRERLSSPSWRPDGSLVTFLRYGEDFSTLEMAILSDPVLVRTIDDEDYVPSPVAWVDRMNMVYTAGGRIRTRGFEDWRSLPLHFRATIQPVRVSPPPVIERRELEVIDPPARPLVVRGARLFDGLRDGYRRDMDVIMEAGRIVAVEPRQPRPDATVIDLGDVTIMPGLIDAAAPAVAEVTEGPGLLAYGITTIVVAERPEAFDASVWESEASPGPRLLAIPGTDNVAGAASVADSGVPGLDRLLSSRQAIALDHGRRPARRFGTPPALTQPRSTVVAVSRENGMHPGIGLHAEILALRAAGLGAEQSLHAAGRNAARALGLEYQAGVIMPDAVADLVIVRGDPLDSVSAVLNIAGVVRNGRFFSQVSLLERARATKSVE